MPPDSGHSDSQNPLWIPEIAQLAFNHSRPADGCCLARTCRRLFNTLMPSVWENIHGAEHVLALLPGAKVITTGSNLEVHITPVLLSDTGRSRFQLYARLVKRLNLFRTDRTLQYKLRGWRHLFARFSGAPLLPNLGSLTFDTCSTAAQFEQIAWVTLFLSPSLDKLRMSFSFWDSHPPPSAATLFFSALASSLPPLGIGETLSIYSSPFPEHLLPASSEGEYTEGSSWFKNMPNLTYLRHLAISVCVLGTEELNILGALPMLESLELIFGPGDGCDIFVPKLALTLPADAFPQLRHLGLIHLPHAPAFRDLWSLDTMVSKLTSVEIQLNKHFWMNALTPAETIQDFVTALCAQSPAVTDLTFQLPPYESPGDESSSSAAMLELLSQLPLQRLRFVPMVPFHVCLAHCRTPHPLLSRLELTTTWVDPLDMRALAEILPNLEYLVVNIIMRREHCENVGSNPFTAPQPITIRIMSVFIESDSDWDRPEHENRMGFLKVLWPKARYLISKTAKDILSRHKLTIL